MRKNSNRATGVGNLHFIEMTSNGAFEFEVQFASGALELSDKPNEIDYASRSASLAFDSHFQATQAPQLPFADDGYINCSKSLLSNLLGGIGYFYGDSKIVFPSESEAGIEASQKPDTSAPTKLFTMVPSRPFFPRGFLWDEGFHSLVLLDWDLDLAIEIIQNWFALMDEDGYIAREQILGLEARSKVPLELQAQNTEHANPPTLFIAIAEITAILRKSANYHGHHSRYIDDEEAAGVLLDELYAKMLLHYHWFRRTQAGDTEAYGRHVASEEGYRWRGRTAQHIFPSGLDDYPRAQPPHTGELHLDALCWVGAMADALASVARHLRRTQEEADFLRVRADVADSLEQLHWSETDQAYCDATVQQETHKLVCHKGYISLLPFVLGIVNASNPHLGFILDLIQDGDELWSPYGIRSLSKKDRYYGTAENYWRSPIWININYLVVKALLDLAKIDGPYQLRARRMYSELRRNVVDTVYRSWRDTGFAWEQYNPETGAGQRTQHFTGWTALVVKIMAMPDLQLATGPSRQLQESARGCSSLPYWLGLIVVATPLIFFRRRLLRLVGSLQ